MFSIGLKFVVKKGEKPTWERTKCTATVSTCLLSSQHSMLWVYGHIDFVWATHSDTFTPTPKCFWSFSGVLHFQIFKWIQIKFKCLHTHTHLSPAHILPPQGGIPFNVEFVAQSVWSTQTKLWTPKVLRETERHSHSMCSLLHSELFGSYWLCTCPMSVSASVPALCLSCTPLFTLRSLVPLCPSLPWGCVQPYMVREHHGPLVVRDQEIPGKYETLTVEGREVARTTDFSS